MPVDDSTTPQEHPPVPAGWPPKRDWGHDPEGDPDPPEKPNGSTLQPLFETPRAVVTRMSDVEPEPVLWLWEGRIPYGKLTCLQGPPGVGKSTMAYGIAAKISRGHPVHPDSPAPEEGASDVLILTHEDGLSDTVRPRLDAAFADCDRIHSFRGTLDKDGHLLFPSIVADLDALENTLRSLGARFMVIDGISGYMGSRTDTHREKEVRKDMMGLADLADRTGTAVLCISHLNKSSGQSAMNRGMGSIAFNAVYRSVLVASRDENQPDSGTYVLARVKGNLAAEPPSIEYRLEERELGALRPIACVWGAISSHTADSLLAEATKTEDHGQFALAKKLLAEAIADGGQVLSRDILKDAEDNGISRGTMFKAKAALGIDSIRLGFGKGGQWAWGLPAKE